MEADIRVDMIQRSLFLYNRYFHAELRVHVNCKFTTCKVVAKDEFASERSAITVINSRIQGPLHNSDS